jgi:hypothetical protein
MVESAGSALARGPLSGSTERAGDAPVARHRPPAAGGVFGAWRGADVSVVQAQITVQQRMLVTVEASVSRHSGWQRASGGAGQSSAYATATRASMDNLTALHGADSDYFSPEATAHRIVDFVAGLYPTYREQHPELTDDEAVNSFHEVAVAAVMQGAREARQALGSLDHEVAWSIHETVDLTVEGLESLRDQLLAAPQQPTHLSTQSQVAA